MEFALPLFAGGFLLGLLAGRWSAVLVPVVFGLFVWSLWSDDREVNAEEIGLFFGTIPTVGAAIGVLVRKQADAESTSERPSQRWRRWSRLVVGLDPTPKQPTKPPKSDGADRDDWRS